MLGGTRGKGPKRRARRAATTKAKAVVWTPVRGNWSFTRDRPVQKDIHGPTGCYRSLAFQDFAASFSMTLTGSADQVQAETKFLFSDAADPQQPYRIDFIYHMGVCRITARRLQFHNPLNLVEGQHHEVQVRVYGNRLDVDVDGLQVFGSVPFGKRSDGHVGFGTYNGTARFDSASIISLAPKTCFVIMPFDQKRDFLYEYVLRPLLESHPKFRFEFEKADEALTVNPIRQDIVDSVERSDLIIADVSEANRNVFYEVGYAHCKSRKTILLVERMPGQPLNLPFDTQNFRHEQYDFSRQGFEKLRARLERLVATLLG